MRTQSPETVGRPSPLLAATAALLIAAATGASGQTSADIQFTKHNLSSSGPGPIRATDEDRICIFCHTPHNATPLSPLWNKELPDESYQTLLQPDAQGRAGDACPPARPSSA